MNLHFLRPLCKKLHFFSHFIDGTNPIFSTILESQSVSTNSPVYKYITKGKKAIKQFQTSASFRPFLGKSGPDSAADFFSQPSPLWSYASELSASWQHCLLQFKAFCREGGAPRRGFPSLFEYQTLLLCFSLS